MKTLLIGINSKFSHTNLAIRSIKEYVKQVKKLGMTAAAITDHGVMYGVIDFYRAAKEEGINPVIGCEVYVAPNSRFDREINGGDDRYYHLVLLAENNSREKLSPRPLQKSE